MEAVIPADVLAHLRELAQRESSLEGMMTTRMIAEGMGVSEDKARAIVRQLLKDKKVRPRRVAITDEQAWELGYLGGAGVLCYEWLDAA